MPTRSTDTAGLARAGSRGRSLVAALVSLALSAASGCDRAAGAGSTITSARGSASSPTGSSGPASASGSSADVAASAAPPREVPPCVAPDCRLFDTAAEAFSTILAENPDLAVLGLGESHAQRGSEGVASTTKRFTEELLPKLDGRATDLVLELWVADPACSKKKVEAVAQKQKEVTEKQAEGNQNEFVKLAEEAKKRGATPHILRPSCEDYDAVLKAGDEGVLVMLDTITRLMGDALETLYAKNVKGKAGKKGKLVVGYGGAMHNDVEPRPGRDKWSFAARLAKASGATPERRTYVELDLIVPEFIKDNSSWQSLPWYGRFDKARAPSKVTVLRTAPGAYALVFASTNK